MTLADRLQRKGAYGALICAAALLTIGLIVLYSASAYARDAHGDSLAFIKRQLMWMVIGGFAGLVACLLPLRIWRRIWIPLVLVTLATLALCFVPGFGQRLNGSSRWIRLGPVGVQPSEFAKLVVVLVGAHFLALPSKSRLAGPLKVLLMVLPMVALILAETDLGTSILLLGTMFFMLFAHGLRLIWIGIGVAVLASAVTYVAIKNPNRLDRIVAFVDSERKDGTNFQQDQGRQAFASGGLTGVGLGSGRQKLQYLPYAHTDFIFPVIGEEMGLRATLAVTGAFFLLGAFAFLQGRGVTDPYAKMLCVGIGSLVLLQAAINIAVTTSLMPNKGMPLPFISAGGSNLCAFLFLLGVLVRVARENDRGTSQA